MSDESDLLGKAAARLEGDDFFMASVLAAYRREFGVSEADIARQLRCAAQDLILVGLCRKPRIEDPRIFVSDLNAIAECARCDSEELARIARAVDAVATLRKLGSGSQHMLLKAARPKRPIRRNRKSSRRKK